MSGVIVGTMVDHLEKHVIKKVKLIKEETDDDVEDVNLDDFAELDDAEETVKL